MDTAHVGVLPKANPIETYIAVWAWGKYLGEEALAQGVDVCISSWTRIAPNTLPALCESGRELHELAIDPHGSRENGYAEGIALDNDGFVSEGSGENIFVVRDGKIHTPPLGASVLPGITRDSIIKIAEQLCCRWWRRLFHARCSISLTKFSSAAPLPK